MINEKSLTGNAAVVGAGTMGGGIAAQLANAGWHVRLLDIATPDARARNAVALAGLERVQKSRPPLLFLPEFARRIEVGNTSDNLGWLREADWVVEAVAERLDIKQAVLAQIEAHVSADAVVSSNTSGLGLGEMSRARGHAFRQRFLGTHFLNPPRYLKLLEVIPTPDTDDQITTGFIRFAERVLGHRVVRAKDTPGFISTRLWIAHLLDTLHAAQRHGLSVEEADYLTGSLIGRPRSATFRMADLVGFDIIAAVAHSQYERLPDDRDRAHLRLPDVLQRLLADNRLGEKSGAGFYRREGKNLETLDLHTLEYRPHQEVRIAAVEALRALPLAERFVAIGQQRSERWGQFLNAILDELGAYVRFVGPDIADDVLAIDRAMEWGFHWEMGPFAISDLSPTFADRHKHYSQESSERTYRVFGEHDLRPVPANPEYVSLERFKAAGKTIAHIAEATLIDLDDGVACLEFHTKMNTFNPALCAFVDQARARAEQDFVALVIGNQAPHFSAGYNLNLFVQAMEAANWAALDAMLRDVQYAFLGLKYARVPVVIAPHGYTLGAGCECALHCHVIQAAPELAMGLPELGVGVIPAGGGTKEMLARAMADVEPGADPFAAIERVFNQIAFPRNSTSALHARAMGFLRASDNISRNPDRQLYDAKQRALSLANAGHTPPIKNEILVLGEEALARLRMVLHWQHRAGAISDHDRLIADKVAFVLSGGNLPYAQTVREEYLLQLERDVFVELAREPKSAERMRHVLATGKPL